MTQTDLANLALSKIGEPFIADITDTGDRVARLAALHYEPTLRELLRAHFWGFAMGMGVVTRENTIAAAILDPPGADNSVLFTAVESGDVGEQISVAYATPSGSGTAVSVSGRAITVIPGIVGITVTGALTTSGIPVAFPVLIPSGIMEGKPAFSNNGNTSLVIGDGGPTHVLQYSLLLDLFGGPAIGRWRLKSPSATWYGPDNGDEATPDLVATWTPSGSAAGVPLLGVALSTAADVIATVNADTAASALVTASPVGTVTGAVAAVAATPLTGGVGNGLIGWINAFTLPADFIKLRKVLTPEGDKIERFDFRRINGERCLVAGDYDEIALDYVQFVDDPDDYDPLFIEAFTTLLAAKLARAVTGSENLEAQLRQLYEQNALPAARTADGHDSQSNENRPLREFLSGNLLSPRTDFFPDHD